MFLKINSVFMFVADIRSSEKWYSEFLGFGPRYSDEKFSLFEVGSINLCFHLADEKTPVRSGGAVAYWWVEDFDGALLKATEAGGKLYRGPIPTEFDLQICQIMDPFGNVFGIEGAIDNN